MHATRLMFRSACQQPGSHTATSGRSSDPLLAADITCERAQLAEGQHILELGCGWGSLSLYMAAKYPGKLLAGFSCMLCMEQNHARHQSSQCTTH